MNFYKVVLLSYFFFLKYKWMFKLIFCQKKISSKRPESLDLMSFFHACIDHGFLWMLTKHINPYLGPYQHSTHQISCYFFTPCFVGLPLAKVLPTAKFILLIVPALKMQFSHLVNACLPYHPYIICVQSRMITCSLLTF